MEREFGVVCSSELLTIFRNAEHRLVLYYLANKNPRINEETLSKETRLPIDRIREILSSLGSERLVKYESQHGYTLTPKGLVGLYNYHITINK